MARPATPWGNAHRRSLRVNSRCDSARWEAGFDPVLAARSLEKKTFEGRDGARTGVRTRCPI